MCPFYPRASGAVVLALVAVALGGCGSRGGPKADTRIDRCADRLAAGSAPTSLSEEQLRRYARATYCVPFDERGWVYDDGALSISVVRSRRARTGECASLRPDGSTRTVPCATLPPSPVLDCGVLRHVRRSEVRAYVAEVREKRAAARPAGVGVGTPVRCDDDTPLRALGVP
jgi:hypothetical protein